MKQFRFFSLAVFLLAGVLLVLAMKPSSEQIKKDPGALQPLGEYLYTVPLRKQMDISRATKEWWHEYIDYSANQQLLQPLFDKINNGEVTVYKPEYPFNVPLSKEEVARIMVPVDTVIYENEFSDLEYVPVKNPVQVEQVVSISFYEDWFYDAENLQIIKQVKGILVHANKGGVNYNSEAPALFYLPFSSSKNPVAPTVETITYDLNLDTILFDHNIKNSVMTFADPSMVAHEKEGVKTVISSLAQKGMQKGTVVCDTLFPFSKPLDKKQIAGRQPKMAAANNLRFLETWGMDPQKMIFTKTVRGVLLMQTNLYSVTEYEHTSWFRRNARVAFFGAKNVKQVNPLAGPVTIDHYYDYCMNGRADFIQKEPLQHADSAKIAGFVASVVNGIRSGEMMAYDSKHNSKPGNPWESNRTPLTKQQVEEVFVKHDTLISEDHATGDLVPTILKYEMPVKDLQGLGFYESWVFDPAAKKFTKSVQAINFMSSTMAMEMYSLTPAFNVNTEPVKDVNAIRQPQYLISSGVRSGFRVDGFEFTGYDDYTSPDVNPGLINYSDNYNQCISFHDRYLLVQQILTMVESGAMTAYEPGKETTMSPLQIHQKLDKYKGSYFPVGDIATDYSLLNMLTFEEDWYYNPVTHEFYKDVKSITFSNYFQDRYENGGDTKEEPVFTVKF